MFQQSKFFGPLPYDKFVDKYMEPPEEYKPVSTVSNKLSTTIGDIPTSRNFTEMYDLLVKCVNTISKSFRLHGDNDFDNKQVINIEVKRKSGKRKAYNDAFSIVLVSNDSDQFLNTTSFGSTELQCRQACQDLLTEFATQFNRQHRAIVTEPINHCTEPHKFIDFFKRLNKLAYIQLGLDMSVTYATPKQKNLLVWFVENFLQDATEGHSISLPNMEETLDPSFPAYAIHLPIEQDMKTSASPNIYIVQKPLHSASFVWGPGTRTYIAYDTRQDKLVFLKDYWRPIENCRDSEVDICEEFKKEFEDEPDVLQHLPVLLHSSHVRQCPNSDQRKTLASAHDWKDEETMRPTAMSMQILAHHRIAQELVLPLLDVPSSKDACSNNSHYVVIIRVFRKTRRLHRDISTLSIMTARLDRVLLRGILNDWDHSKKMLPGSKLPDHRVGTWSFLSIGLASEPDKSHTLLDDLESCFWVLLHLSVHRFPAKVEGVLLGMLHESRPGFDDLMTGNPRTTVIFDCKPLDDLIQELRAHYEVYYAMEDLKGTHVDEKLKEFHQIHIRVNDVEEILKIYDKALSADGWVANDGVPDRFPPINPTTDV
ncbi:hypothetical protein C8Q75DRAFT_805514 [Abortiporus biennis]|nr:hypothetical protein C8Q75DRAFT_805514 [Abortiporus biennis]